jgi:hypothetical protein
MEREALKLALEALEAVNPSLVCDMAHHSKKYQHGIGQTCPLEIRHLETITAIKAALAQPPLPVQREWVGLTDEEAIEIQRNMVYGNHSFIKVIKAIEVKLKEKNNG